MEGQPRSQGFRVKGKLHNQKVKTNQTYVEGILDHQIQSSFVRGEIFLVE